MSEALNKVRMVLPLGPGTPHVTLDGIEIKGLVAAQLDHDPRAGTVLHLALVAEVTTDTHSLPDDADEDTEAEEGQDEDEWEFIGHHPAGLTFEKNRRTGEQRKVPRR